MLILLRKGKTRKDAILDFSSIYEYNSKRVDKIRLLFFYCLGVQSTIFVQSIEII